MRSFGMQFRAEEINNEPVIEGYFVVFGDVYEIAPGYTENTAPSAFDGALQDDIRALIDHDTRLVLGRTSSGTLELRVDAYGLWGRIRVNKDDQEAMNLYARVKRGDVSQCSYGFDILDEEKTIDNATGAVHWTIKKVKLYEVSVVTFPAYKATEVTARAEEIQVMKKRQLDGWREKLKRRLHKEWH